MSMKGKALELEAYILDILAVNPESFPIIHTDLTRHYGRDDQPDSVADVLSRMENGSLIRAYSPKEVDGAYWDEAKTSYQDWLQKGAKDGYLQDVGPWFEITPKGLARLEDVRASINWPT
jgi:hypothetical protein